MSGDIGIGRLIEGEAHRDAIHVAVAPMVAGQKLRPGDWIVIGATIGEAFLAASPQIAPGIVDPFLPGPVREGERFWMFLRPGSITSLRHDWTHPAFEAAPAAKSPDKEKSEAWLRDFVGRSDCPEYEVVIATAIGGGSRQWSGEYLHFNDRDAHGEIPPEFWDHVEVVTGQTIPRDERPAYFSCSC